MRFTARPVLRAAISVAVISLFTVNNRQAFAVPACPVRSAAMSVVGWLVAHADAVTTHHYTSASGHNVEASGYPKTSTDPNFINALLRLTGSYVRWNGYNSYSPFGNFNYPNGGAWYAEYEVHTGAAVHYVWLWRSYWRSPGPLLVFTFADMGQATDSQGQHLSEHNFCMTSVPLWIINRLDLSA